MKNNVFAIYKGKEYQADVRSDSSIILRSYDENDVNNGFIQNKSLNKAVKCYKYVLKSELEDLYRKKVVVKYNEYEFLVMDEKDDMLLIYTMAGDYRVWHKLGMEIMDKGVYQKWVYKKDLIIKSEIERIGIC